MCRNNESGRYVLSSFCGYFSKPCSGCCPKDKQSCVDGTADTVLARATYTKGVKNVAAVCSPMDLCRGSQNRCQPRRRITLDRSPLELRFLSTEWAAANYLGPSNPRRTHSTLCHFIARLIITATRSQFKSGRAYPSWSSYPPTNFLHEQNNFRQCIVVLAG
jgi:hypothetical protein